MDASYSMHIPQNQTPDNLKYYNYLNDYWNNGVGTNLDKLRSFTKYVPVAEINKFLVKNELFKKILTIHGSILEGGVHLGGGLMTWANLSAIYEPLNHVRKVVGFDTFTGFVSINDKDEAPIANAQMAIGGLAAPAYEDLQNAIRIFDSYRPLGHIQKLELVKGDVQLTAETYLAQNPHLVVAMLYLDFDLFEPTKKFIEVFLPRMPKGAIIVFDELNIKHWPGETLAVLETIGIRNLRIERFTHYPQISYAILE